RQAVLSHALWRDRFGADPSIVGQPLRLDDEAFEIIGVLPPGPVFPEESELWLLARDEVPEIGAGAPMDVKALRDARYFTVLARLGSIAPRLSPRWTSSRGVWWPRIRWTTPTPGSTWYRSRTSSWARPARRCSC